MAIKTMKLPEITLDWLKEKDACSGGYKYCAEVKITEPLALINRLIEDNHHAWANWLIVRIMDRKQQITYAVYAAELVLPIFEKKYPDDLRPRKAIEAAKKCLELDSVENKKIAIDSGFTASAAYALVSTKFYCAYSSPLRPLYAIGNASSAAKATYFAAQSAAAADDEKASFAAEGAVVEAYFATHKFNKSKSKTYAKILAHGIEILTEDKQ